MRTTIVRIGATGAGAVLALGLFAAAPPAGAASSGNHGVNSADSTCFTASGPQGRSHSDPDGMSNGGADKPGCTGGIDADRDGNNGCGNDADREDDDNGWCGRKPKGDNGNAATPPSGSPGSTTSTSTATTTTAPPPVSVPPTTAGLTDCQVDPNEATDCPAAASASTTGAQLSVAATVPATSPASAIDRDTVSDVMGSVAGTIAGPSGDVAGAATTSSTTPGTEVLGETLDRPSSLPRTGAAVGGLTLLGLGLFGSGRLTVLARRLLRIG